MTAEKDIEKKLEELSQAISSNESMVEEVMSYIDTKSIANPSVVNTQNIWRIIVKSQITKYTAAAVVILTVGIGMYFFTGDGTIPAYGISDVPGLLHNANTLHVKGLRTYILKGQEPISCPIEYWMDFENLRYRKREVYRGRTRDGRLSDDYYENEIVFDTKYIMIIDHTRKTVEFAKRTPFRTRFELRVKKDRDVILRDFYLKTDQLKGFKKTGRENIDGVLFDIWKKKEDHPWQQRITEYHINPTTGELGRYFRRFLYDTYYSRERAKDDKYRDPYVSLNEDEQEWHEHLLTCIERNKPLQDDIFKLEPPGGYTITTSKDEVPNLGEIGHRTIPSASGMTVSISYTLKEDDSVIMAWSDRSDNFSKSQEVLFDGLEPGDSLPELTFVPYALHPNFSVYRKINEAVTYIGRHLAHTSKGNVHFEWSIYVPDSEPPESGFYSKLAYGALVRRNPDDGQTRRMGLVPDVTINSAKEFDELVLGAMAELSNDGKAPEGITYEKVLQLSQKIRKSLTQ